MTKPPFPVIPERSIFAPKPKTKAAQYQRDRYWRDKEPQSPAEKVLVVNAESSLGYRHRKAADRTLSIGRVS